jgi:hypothetical protein
MRCPLFFNTLLENSSLSMARAAVDEKTGGKAQSLCEKGAIEA